MLKDVKDALTAIHDRVYRYSAPPNAKAPYLVWGDDGANYLFADGRHIETAVTGTVDLYTKDEDDQLIDSVENALGSTECAWYLNSVQYEEETGLIHREWVFEE